MADSSNVVGEAKVRIVADASGFKASLEAAIATAMSGYEHEVPVVAKMAGVAGGAAGAGDAGVPAAHAIENREAAHGGGAGGLGMLFDAAHIRTEIQNALNLGAFTINLKVGNIEGMPNREPGETAGHAPIEVPPERIVNPHQPGGVVVPPAVREALQGSGELARAVSSFHSALQLGFQAMGKTFGNLDPDVQGNHLERLGELIQHLGPNMNEWVKFRRDEQGGGMYSGTVLDLMRREGASVDPEVAKRARGAVVQAAASEVLLAPRQGTGLAFRPVEGAGGSAFSSLVGSAQFTPSAGPAPAQATPRIIDTNPPATPEMRTAPAGGAAVPFPYQPIPEQKSRETLKKEAIEAVKSIQFLDRNEILERYQQTFEDRPGGRPTPEIELSAAPALDADRLRGLSNERRSLMGGMTRRRNQFESIIAGLQPGERMALPQGEGGIPTLSAAHDPNVPRMYAADAKAQARIREIDEILANRSNPTLFSTLHPSAGTTPGRDIARPISPGSQVRAGKTEAELAQIDADDLRHREAMGGGGFRRDVRRVGNQSGLVGEVNGIQVDLRPIVQAMLESSSAFFKDEAGKVFGIKPQGETPGELRQSEEQVARLGRMRGGFHLPGPIKDDLGNERVVTGRVKPMTDMEVLQHWASQLVGEDQPSMEAVMGFLDSDRVQNTLNLQLREARRTRAAPMNQNVGDFNPGGSMNRPVTFGYQLQAREEERTKLTADLEKLSDRIDERSAQGLDTSRDESREAGMVGHLQALHGIIRDLRERAGRVEAMSPQEARDIEAKDAVAREQSRLTVSSGRFAEAYDERHLLPGVIEPLAKGKAQRQGMLSFLGLDADIPTDVDAQTRRDMEREAAGDFIRSQIAGPTLAEVYGPGFRHEMVEDVRRPAMNEEQLRAEIEDAKKRKAEGGPNAEGIDVGAHEQRLAAFQSDQARGIPSRTYPLTPESPAQAIRRVYESNVKDIRQAIKDQREMAEGMKGSAKAEALQTAKDMETVLKEVYQDIAQPDRAQREAAQEAIDVREGDARIEAGRTLGRDRSFGRSGAAAGIGRFSTREEKARGAMQDALRQGVRPTTTLEREHMAMEAEAQAALQPMMRSKEGDLMYDPKGLLERLRVAEDELSQASPRNSAERLAAQREAKAAVSAVEDPIKAADKNLQTVRRGARSLVQEIMAGGATSIGDVRGSLASRVGLTQEAVERGAGGQTSEQVIGGITDQVVREALEVLQHRAPNNMYQEIGALRVQAREENAEGEMVPAWDQEPKIDPETGQPVLTKGGHPAMRRVPRMTVSPGRLVISPQTTDRSLSSWSGDRMQQQWQGPLNAPSLGGPQEPPSPGALALSRREAEAAERSGLMAPNLGPDVAAGPMPTGVADTARLESQLRTARAHRTEYDAIEQRIREAEARPRPTDVPQQTLRRYGGPPNPRLAELMAGPSRLATPGDDWLGQSMWRGPYEDPALHMGGGPSAFTQMDYGQATPPAGSKVHVSAIASQANQTLEIVDRIAKAMDVTYKFVHSRQELEPYAPGDPRATLAPRPFAEGGTQQGKFITAYPTPEQAPEFTEMVAQALDAAGIGMNAPLAPSEVQYGASPITHRYTRNAGTDEDLRYLTGGAYAAERPSTVPERPYTEEAAGVPPGARMFNDDELKALHAQREHMISQGRGPAVIDAQIADLERQLAGAAGGAAGGVGGEPPRTSRGRAPGGGGPTPPGGSYDAMVPGGEVYVIIKDQMKVLQVSMSGEGGGGGGTPAERARGTAAMDRANFQYATSARAEQFTQRKIDEFRTAGKTDEQIAQLFRGTPLANMAATLGIGGPGGAGGGTGAAHTALRRQLGLPPLTGTDVTEPSAQEADALRAQDMVKAERADRAIFRRGFQASLTDFIQAPAFEQQALKIDRFRHEATQLATIRDNEVKQTIKVREAKETLVKAEEAQAAIANRQSQAFRTAGVRVRAAQRIVGDEEAALTRLGTQREAQEGIRNEAEGDLPGGMGALRNLAVGAIAGGIATAGASIVFQLSSQALAAAEAALGPALEKAADNMMGFANTASTVGNTLAEATRQMGGLAEQATAQAAGTMGLGRAVFDLYGGGLAQRADIQAGNQALVEQRDFTRAGRSVAGNQTGLFQPGGGIAGLSRSTGGWMGSDIGSTPDTVKVLTETLPGAGMDPQGVFQNLMPTVSSAYGALQQEIYGRETLRNSLMSEGAAEGKMPYIGLAEASPRIVAEMEATVTGWNENLEKSGAALRLHTEASEASADALGMLMEAGGVSANVIQRWQNLGIGLADEYGRPMTSDQLQGMKPEQLVDMFKDVFGGIAEGAGMPTSNLIFEGMSKDIDTQIRSIQAQSDLALRQMQGQFAMGMIAAPPISLENQLFGSQGAPGGLLPSGNRVTYGAGGRTVSGSWGEPVGGGPLPSAMAGVPDAYINTWERLGETSTTALEDINRLTEEGLGNLEEFGLKPEQIDQIREYGTAIKDLQQDSIDRQLAASIQDYNRGLEIGKRTVGDLIGLNDQLSTSVKGVGEVQATNLGVLERTVLEKGRELTLLGQELTQRQINFRLATAGFRATGRTPEEIAANKIQAEYEAGIAQKQLNLNKDITGAQFQIVDIQNIRNAEQGIKDLEKYIRDYDISVNIKGNEVVIGELETLRGHLVGEAGIITGEFQGIEQMAIQMAATVATQTDESFDVVFKNAKEAIDDVSDSYRVMLELVGLMNVLPSGNTVSEDENGRTVAGSWEERETLPSGNVMIEDERGRTVGGSWDTGGGGMVPAVGGTSMTINGSLVSFGDVTVRSQEDLDEIVRAVETSLDRTSAMIGLRSPVGS